MTNVSNPLIELADTLYAARKEWLDACESNDTGLRISKRVAFAELLWDNKATFELALRAAVNRDDWQPIETAPKDRQIWVWGRGHGLAGGFTWQGASCWDDVFPETVPPKWGYLPSGVIPEYWRELPAPPQT